jgi:hypothetical protein
MWQQTFAEISSAILSRNTYIGFGQEVKKTDNRVGGRPPYPDTTHYGPLGELRDKEVPM